MIQFIIVYTATLVKYSCFLMFFSQVISLFFSYSDGGRMSMLGLGDIVRVLVFF